MNGKNILKSHCYHDLKSMLNDFVALDKNIIGIDPIQEGYSTVDSFKNSVMVSIRKYGYKDLIRARQVGNKVYLFKTEGNHD